ncbi:succinate dehydrogenase, cytochrome b556 subunit [Haliea sp.]|uniref:succinate dehydrogenase, cytochrome b556 subunit n=1 Tax=Haliea TaxID=475794 RepID=UPI000C44A088|nr:succinate dehydrogenase, cytochrome b556 subunit [Haliea sp.]HAN68666.1 succinate dehydrogenase, cytochrome b556 subunit [Halieaceae bacterium]MAD63555.1 succinate dehydrogenase, cytochrome b556 subunit [Haliea sp.]MAY93377.1 succinate dehydrogenase, cytochrome b556 subunit [Haliea sp.]MBK41136.1 succinate dehydrogenase, cytochrome b556 subunit [Haliea sp.]MBP71430.1 succinate dehydrogenase, cytochrome b556 subunit [Haliea sp.]
MKDKRPVNLDIGSMRLPITAWASITHRASGVFLFFAMVFLVWALDMSLRSPEDFAVLQDTLTGPLAKLILWAVVAGLIYHALAGIKHIIMDFGIGESFEGGALGARLVIGLSVVLTLLAGVLIW